MNQSTNGHQDPSVDGAPPLPDAAAQTVAAIAQAQTISADEIALYDRQIRLWGVQAQNRIRSANILLVSVKAVGTEIAKNLILNGINSLTIVDSGIISDDDLGAQYFLRDEDVGGSRAQAAVPRLQELNPRVSVNADTSEISQKDPVFYSTFDMIIACDLDFATMGQINAACRIANRPFYATGIHGFYGFIFADLISHEYIVEREKSNVSTQLKAETATRSVIAVSTKKQNGKNIEMVTKRELYSPLILANTSPLAPEYLRNRRKLRSVTSLLPCLRALWEFQRTYQKLPSHSHEDLALFTTLATEKHKELQLPIETLKSEFLRSFLQNIDSELVPTAAFVGGRLAEDVINVLGKREQPLQNLALFDGENFDGPIYALHPIFDTAAPLPIPTAPVVAQDVNGSLPISGFDGSGVIAMGVGQDAVTIL
ncbi:E1 ubiquitin-activating protein aos1 [Taxawa tesnikishii (nom. ined.)]|nr:E1 ubiquitin-activating protein aos1 [Dothideales sp. JES 119]